MDIFEKIKELINFNHLEAAFNLIIENESNYVNNAEYWNLKGVLCLKIHEYQTAISCLNNALKLDPNNADVCYNLAFTFDSLGCTADGALYNGLAFKNTNDEQLKAELSNLYIDNPETKYIFDTAANGRKKAFIMLSSCGWGDIYQRMHHVARSLAKFGHEVIYICPGINVDVNNENITIEDITRYSIDNAKIVDGVKIYFPFNAIYQERPIKGNYVHLIQHLLDHVSKYNETVLVTYLPSQVNVAKQLSGKFYHIYECVDDHSDIELAFWGNQSDVIWEQELMDTADAITTTATSLFLNRTVIEGRKNVFLSRNAVNQFDFINEKVEIPEDLACIPEPRIVYTGAIYEWFDMELFYGIVKANPSKSFVIIGFGKEELFYDKPPNLYFLGAKNHSLLKNYLRHMQVGIIPFKAETELIINCDPIKHYEYLASGIPVVTTYLPESAFKINTYIADSVETFSNAISSCLKKDFDSSNAVDFLELNSWNARAALLLNIANKQFPQINSFEEIRNGLLPYVNKAPVFDALYGLSLLLEENEKGSKYLFAAAERNSRYIQKLFLNFLYRYKEYPELKKAVMESPIIPSYLKAELAYLGRSNNNREHEIVIIRLAIGRFYEVIKKMKFQNNKMKDISIAYVCLLLGDTKSFIKSYEKIRTLSENEKSPLELYLLARYYELTDDFQKFRVYSNLLGEAVLKQLNQKRELTFVIPTYNRPILLRRCLEYIADMKCDNFLPHIIVCDGSADESVVINGDTINSLADKRVDIFHYVSKEGPDIRMLRGLQMVKTDFCCLCADDDTYYKLGILMAMDIYNDNDEIKFVGGKTKMFLNNDTSKLYDYNGRCRTSMEPSAADRLLLSTQQWIPQYMYSVYRTEDILPIFRSVYENNEMIDPVFKEYLLYFSWIISGKVLCLQEILNIRDESSSSGSYLVSGFWDIAIKKEFNQNYILFKERILALAQNILIDQEYIKLKDQIDQIFKSFIMNSWGVEPQFIIIEKEGFNEELLKEGFAIKKQELLALNN